MSGFLGPYAGFILASYGLAGLTVFGLIAWVWLDHRALERQRLALEARGLRRRSAAGPDTGAGERP